MTIQTPPTFLDHVLQQTQNLMDRRRQVETDPAYTAGQYNALRMIPLRVNGARLSLAKGEVFDEKHWLPVVDQLRRDIGLRQAPSPVGPLSDALKTNDSYWAGYAGGLDTVVAAVNAKMAVSEVPTSRRRNSPSH